MEKKHSDREYAGYWIRRFLCSYLTDVRNLSVNTIKSYRDAIRLLIAHICESRHMTADSILITDMSSKAILQMLDSLECSRNCSVKTRNLRLSAFVALAKFVAANSPEHIEWCREIRNIPVKKAPRTLITYLEKEEMDALLDTPDRNTEQGWRDYVLLLFLYNTGARAEEAASLPPAPAALAVSNDDRAVLCAVRSQYLGPVIGGIKPVMDLELPAQLPGLQPSADACLCQHVRSGDQSVSAVRHRFDLIAVFPQALHHLPHRVPADAQLLRQLFTGHSFSRFQQRQRFFPDIHAGPPLRFVPGDDTIPPPESSTFFAYYG